MTLDNKKVETDGHHEYVIEHEALHQILRQEIFMLKLHISNHDSSICSINLQKFL